MSHNQSYVTRLFVSMLALALIPVMSLNWPELAVAATSPFSGIAPRNVGIWQGMADDDGVVRNWNG
jgi:hypothetical protein